MNDIILVDINGYNEFMEELESLKKLMSLNAAEGSKAYTDAVGDGWHDNFAFEQSMIKERNIANQIEKMLEDSKKLKIIKKDYFEENTVNINCLVKLEFTYQNDIKEIECVKLTGNYFPKLDGKIMEITLNSPLGKAIYKKRINERSFYYINDNKIDIKILEVDLNYIV